MDASMLAQPSPLQATPAASPEELVNRTQQWLQIMQSPTVQQELQRYKAMQGMLGFGTRMTQNLGMGIPGVAAFGNAVGHGMDVMGGIDQEMLKSSAGLAKQQAVEDEARMQRMQVGEQQAETKRSNIATEAETKRYHDILGGYYSKLGAAAVGKTEKENIFDPAKYAEFYALLEKSMPTTDAEGNPIPENIRQKQALMSQYLSKFQQSIPAKVPTTAESIVAEQNKEFEGMPPSKPPVVKTPISQFVGEPVSGQDVLNKLETGVIDTWVKQGFDVVPYLMQAMQYNDLGASEAVRLRQKAAKFVGTGR